MVFWIIVIICLLTLGATLFFIFDPAKKEWEKIDEAYDRAQSAYWNYPYDDPQRANAKVAYNAATQTRNNFKKTRKYRRIKNSEEIIDVLGPITIILAIVILIIGMILGFTYIFAEATRAELLAEREVLQWEIDQNLYINDDDVVGHKELFNNIREWNKELAYNKRCERNFWIGIFVPNIYSDIEPLVIK